MREGPLVDEDLNAAIVRRPDKQGDAYALPLNGDFAPTPAVGLAFSIKKLTIDQKYLEEPPWYGAGGSWTFIEAEIEGAALLIGFNTEPAGMRGLETYESGDGVLIAPDQASAEKLLGAFAAYLRMTAPTTEATSEPRPLSMRVGIFARDLIRDPAIGSFTQHPSGTWTCSKLTIEVDALEVAAEIYFNFDPSRGVGEFSEKEPEYREDVMSVLRYGFRPA